MFAGRDYRIRLSKIATDQAGRYGEEVAPRVIGIEYFEQYKVRDAIGNWTDVRPMTITIESKRHEWEILRPASSAISVSSVVGWPVFEHTNVDDAALGGYAPSSVEGLDFGFQADEIGPWARVNNCTRADAGTAPEASEIDDWTAEYDAEIRLWHVAVATNGEKGG